MAKQLTAADKDKLLERFKSAALSTGGRVHIVPIKEGWAVKKEGAKRATSIQKTKAGAVKAANGLKAVDQVVVHRKDGTIERNTKAPQP